MNTAPAASREWFWSAWALAAAFGAYFCMYAFRKPFTAASFAGSSVAGSSVGQWDFKTILVTAQVLGYTISKFAGIRIVSEIARRRRALCILWLVLLAEAALVLFGLVPRPWNVVCLFLNGLPLGMVFGMVLGLLEGRRTTEALTAGLCASFILADGATKSAGAWLLTVGVSEAWMPAAAGGLFLLPLALCVAMLTRVPPPSAADAEARCERTTMNAGERWSFLNRYFTGVTLIVVIYFCVTILRSLRADFAPEIWKSLGLSAQPSTFTQSEIWVALGVLTVNGLTAAIHNNRRAFFSSLGVCAAGVGMLAAAVTLLAVDRLSPFTFMVLLGLGLYLPYAAIHTTVFERWLAMTRDRGTISFLMYVVDSIGYLGYVLVMLGHQLFPKQDAAFRLLVGATWITIGISTLCLILAWLYFARIAAAGTVEVGSIQTAEEPS